MSFDQNLAAGRIGESEIAQYFMRQGYSILPVYEKTVAEMKGPVLFTQGHGNLICPDMLVMNREREKYFWIEAKRKSSFSYYRIGGYWVTGIDLHHYHNYLKIVDHVSPWPVWLLFLHEKGEPAKDTPEGMVSPVGLFGNDLNVLRTANSHISNRHGRSGMIYWSKDHLLHIRDYQDPEPMKLAA